MLKVLAKMFIVTSVCIFTFLLLQRYAPSTNTAVFSGHALLWWHVCVAMAGLITFKMVR